MNHLVKAIIESLDSAPEEWVCSGYELRHPKATIWIANRAYGLNIKSAFGQWGGVVFFALPGSSRWHLWRAFKRWQAAKLLSEFSA